jgi:adenylate cyclase
MEKSDHRHKILIVDDNEGNLNFLRLTFCEDYLVLTANDGDEALKELSKRENSDIALILTDQRMPGISGSELLEESKKTHPNAIRMIITGFPELYNSVHAINKINVDKYIIKPVHDKIHELKGYVRDAIKRYDLKIQNDYLLNELKKVIEKDIRIRNLFSKYLPPEIIRKIERKKDRRTLQEVEEKEVTVMYSDIRGFTSISENLTPLETVQLLNRYFNTMSRIIIKHKGTIDKYIGDAIMAVFGTRESERTEPVKDAQNAVRCALEMRKTLHGFNDHSKNQDMPEIHFGIGINTGKAVVGNIGSDYLLDYTVIGSVVNTAARIEDLTCNKPDTILIGEETYNKAKNLTRVDYEKWDPQDVKGKGTIQVYGVLNPNSMGKNSPQNLEVK